MACSKRYAPFADVTIPTLGFSTNEHRNYPERWPLPRRTAALLTILLHPLHFHTYRAT